MNSKGKLQLSDVFGEEKIYNQIQGHKIHKTSFLTPNGEIYLNDVDLKYKDFSSHKVTFLAEEVGEWIYIDDSQILFQYYHEYEPYFCIVDIKGKRIGSGIITQSKSLLYKQGTQIIRESNGEKTIVMELNCEDIACSFDDDSFYLIKYYPCSEFTYNKYYDENGGYLKDKTEKHFMWLLMRDIVYIFIDSKKYFSIMENEDLYKENKIFYDKLHAIESDTQRLTYEVIDEIIDLLRTIGALNRYSYSSYEKVKQLLYNAKIYNDIEIPILNIFSLNMSGKYGRSSARFSSNNITTRLKKLYNTFGPEDFKLFVYDAKKLNKYMDDI